MSLLGDEIHSLHRELDVLAAGDGSRRIIAELDSVLEQLEPCYKKIEKALGDRTILLESPVQVLISDKFDQEDVLKVAAVQSYDKLAESWREARATIRQSGVVADFVGAVDLYRDSLRETNKSQWNAWVDSVSSEFAVTDVQIGTIEKVPGYKKPIAEYRSGAQRFAELTKYIPQDVDTIKKLIALAERLQVLKSGFKFDLPKDVLAFFNQLDATGSFPLDKFTLELAEQLKKLGGLKDLVVKHGGIGRFGR